MGEVIVVLSHDKNINKEIHDAFKRDLLDKRVPDDHCEPLFGLLDTVFDKNFPGAILPVFHDKREYGALLVYDKTSDWYKLSPILKAFTGPSLSSFNGELLIPDLGNLLDRYRRSLISTFSLCEIKLAPGKDNFIAVRSLNRAVLSYLNRPNLYSEIPLPTAFMIRNFEEALLIGDKNEAWKIIDALDKNFKLDSMNLRFMEIQLFAQFGEWKKIVNLPDFKDICTTRKTAVVLNHILNALRVSYIKLSDPIDIQLQAYQEHIRNFSEFLFNSSTVTNIDPSNACLLAYEASLDPDNFNYFAELEQILPKEDPSRSLLTDFPQSVSIQKQPEGSLTSIFKTLSNLKEIEAVSYRAAIRDEYALLSEEDKALVDKFISVHTQFQEIDLTERRDPNNWLEWFERIADQDYSDYSLHARCGAVEWANYSGDMNNQLGKEIYAVINEAIDDSLRSERIIECLPYFVKWMLKDEESYPLRSMVRVYSGLITLLALRPVQSSLETLGSSQILISALLDCGLDRESYVQLLDDLDVMSGDGIGVSQVYWILEMIEELYQHSAPDNSARQTFFYKISSKIQQIYSRLTRAQANSVDLLFGELDLDVPHAKVSLTKQNTNYWLNLKNKKVCIYTLTETAGKRAGQILQKLEPTIQVTVNSQHGGSEQLKALCENSDFFVISWLSAKHAATDFIRQHRTADKIIYAQGKGASSIIRSLESALSF